MRTIFLFIIVVAALVFISSATEYSVNTSFSQCLAPRLSANLNLKSREYRSHLLLLQLEPLIKACLGEKSTGELNSVSLTRFLKFYEEKMSALEQREFTLSVAQALQQCRFVSEKIRRQDMVDDAPGVMLVGGVGLHGMVDFKTTGETSNTSDNTLKIKNALIQPGGVVIRCGGPLVSWGHSTDIFSLTSSSMVPVLEQIGMDAEVIDTLSQMLAWPVVPNIYFRDENSDEETELKAFPPSLDAKTEKIVEQVFVESFVPKIKPGQFAIIGSAYPANASLDYLPRKISQLKSRGGRVVVNWSSGYSRKQALEILKSSPDYIKPNLSELAFIASISPTGTLTETEYQKIFSENPDAVISEVRKLLEYYNIGAFLLSMGGDGAMLINKDNAYKAVPPAITAQSTVGAGDMFVAGFVHAASVGFSNRESLRFAVASASTFVQSPLRVPTLSTINAFSADVYCDVYDAASSVLGQSLLSSCA